MGKIQIIKTTVVLLLGMSFGLALKSSFAQTLDISADNFRETRYNPPSFFSQGDNFLLSASVTDLDTGTPAVGTAVTVTNSVTGEEFGFSGCTFGCDVSQFVPYNSARALGAWTFSASLGGSNDTDLVAAYGTGPGTGPMPGVNSLSISDNDVTPTYTWTNPPAVANGTANGGNIDRFRIRIQNLDGTLVFDEQQPSGLLTTTAYTLPDGILAVTPGCYVGQVLIEGLNPFIRSRTFELFSIDGGCDSDLDGIGEAFDHSPSASSNLCSGADANIDTSINSSVQCAAPNSVTIRGTADVIAGGGLSVIAQMVTIEPGFSVRGEFAISSVDPCPGCPAPPPLPALSDAAAQTYTQNTAIPTLSFVNTGGGSLTNCSANSLPAGLTVVVSSDRSTCEISGTPTIVQAATSHTITATNATGNSTAMVDITVNSAPPPLPALSDAAAQTYTQNTAIPTLSFVNTGGGSLINCSANTLPTGLTVAVSSDGSTCEISGTPTIVQAATSHTITATNVAGNDAASVNITVNPAAPPLPALSNAAAQTYTENTAIPTVSFVNTGGGSLINCSANTLPTGLTVMVSSDGSTCEISGTPTIAQAATSHTITATNVAGNDAALVNITVESALALPALADAPAQTYTENTAITTLSFVNTGGGSLTNCSANSLPAGLTVAVSSDGSTCDIAGTPTAIQTATSHTITATNATGSDTALVDITVNPTVDLTEFDDALLMPSEGGARDGAIVLLFQQRCFVTVET